MLGKLLSEEHDLDQNEAPSYTFSTFLFRQHLLQLLAANVNKDVERRILTLENNSYRILLHHSHVLYGDTQESYKAYWNKDTPLEIITKRRVREGGSVWTCGESEMNHGKHDVAG